jgi:hypothetical protein
VHRADRAFEERHVVQVHVALEVGGGLLARHRDAVRQAHVLDDVEALLHDWLVVAQLQQQVIRLRYVERALSLTVHVARALSLL